MRYLLFIVFSALAVEAVASGREESKQPAVYKNWPACKRGREYVEVIKKEDRQEGEIYHERTKTNGLTKTYLCQPCTKCASGVLELRSCSTRSDTECSSTKCTVEGCILDDTFHACRLPGDIDQFDSISEMMDPCDPNKATTESKNTKDSLTEAPKSEPSSPKEENGAENAPPKPQVDESKGKQEVRWGSLEVTLVVVMATLLVIFSGILIFLFRHNRKREQLTAERQVASSTGEGDSITSV